jgi:hypothetical protein
MRQAATPLPDEPAAPDRRISPRTFRQPTNTKDIVASQIRRRMYHGFF